MKFLLDTCAFLWFIKKDARLPSSLIHLIVDPQNDIWLSVVSLWECLIKEQTGRLTFPQPSSIYLPIQRERHQIQSLTLDESSVAHLPKLPLHHKDPFDRILICQAMEYGLTIITPDDLITRYPVKTIWMTH